MTDQREETGYTKKEPAKKRVPISKYGEKAGADKAKEELKQFMNQPTRGK